jgi:TolB-like protein
MAASYKFGPFCLDAEGEVLLRGAEPVALGRRAVVLLRTLIERPGVVISKEALIEAAWSGLTVEESNLPVQIAALRRALEEAPGGEHRIDTLPRRGYRFVGTVAKDIHGSIALASMEASPLSIPDKPSIAVLPFTNLSDDPARDYFADGMTEDIITELSRFRSLFVIARNSTFTYKGRAVDVKRVGHELGVRYALEGSVRQAGDRVRITAQLIEAASRAHLWADRFDGGWRIFSICRIELQQVLWALSRQNWSRPKSNTPSASRPRTSTPTTIFCGGWRAYIATPRRTTTKHYAFSGGPSISTPILPQPTE